MSAAVLALVLVGEPVPAAEPSPVTTGGAVGPGAVAFGAAPRERGVSLGLFSADGTYDYAPLLREIAAVGADHVSITYVWWQDDVAATEIGPVPGLSATDAQIVAALTVAKQLGLSTTLFPILRLRTEAPGAWRGTIAPRDEDRWWASYREAILHAADLARRGGAARLSVGSELVSREHDRERWRDLLDRVRVRAPGLALSYSSNWDHFRPVRFWDLVDVVGVTAYFELTRDPAASTDDLRRAWAPIVEEMRAWSAQLGRPLLFTEVGYPSVDGSAMWPWNSTRRTPVDLEEQRRAYAAFALAWGGQAFVDGVHFWNWFGVGGPACPDYTPRGKPAAQVLERWFASPRFPTARPSHTKIP